MDSVVAHAFSEARMALDEFVHTPATGTAVDAVVDRIEECFQNGGKILAAGNGGSMADAMHFAEEWTGRFKNDRRPFPAMALCDPTHLTCVSNDFGFEHVFSRMVAAFARPGDIVLLLSTSGQSANLINAAEEAKQAGATVIGFLGKGGGALTAMCDIVLMAPGKGSDRIQELHMLTLHAIIDAVERRLGV
ncbi:MAG TPA: SIS domain-containing protein [Fimbriimonas sp.]|nr:SIS domain-containing protein [Fimbriimonas sp.]